MTKEQLEKLRQPVENFTRCCGWLVQKSSSNPGKQQEYIDRLVYTGEIKD